MKGKDGIKSDNLTKKKVSDKNKEIVVFAFFLFLSFVFWYLNSLGKDTEADIRCSVKFINPPSGKVIYSEPPGKMVLYLKGPGYEILKLRLTGNNSPVNVDISKTGYKRVPGNSTYNYYIITAGLIRSLNVQLRSQCEIMTIKPDTLFFKFDKQVSASDFKESENKLVKRTGK